MKTSLLLSCLASMLLLASGCDDPGVVPDAGSDAGPPDAGTDGGADAGTDAGACTEFTPELCPRTYPMDPIPMAMICEAFADIFCRANQRCCEREEEKYPILSQCLSDQLARCHDEAIGYELTDALAADRVSYSAAAMGEQLARIGPRADACEPVRIGDAILMVIQGRVGGAQACTLSPECVDGYDCRDGFCQMHLAAGAACTSHEECAFRGLRCASGACEARLADGEGCTEDEECESLLCVDGTCEPSDGGAFYCVRQGAPGRAFER